MTALEMLRAKRNEFNRLGERMRLPSGGAAGSDHEDDLTAIIVALEAERRELRSKLDPEELAASLLEGGFTLPIHLNAVETVLGCARYAEALALLDSAE
jgi:hypothetical protein